MRSVTLPPSASAPTAFAMCRTVRIHLGQSQWALKNCLGVLKNFLISHQISKPRAFDIHFQAFLNFCSGPFNPIHHRRSWIGTPFISRLASIKCYFTFFSYIIFHSVECFIFNWKILQSWAKNMNSIRQVLDSCQYGLSILECSMDLSLTLLLRLLSVFPN